MRKKNADHQSIPRFEQLVDVGLLTKPVEAALRGRKLDRARRAWSFVVTEAAERLAAAATGPGEIAAPEWRWNGFGAAVGASGIAGQVATHRLDLNRTIKQFVECYQEIRRRAGHTPFESVAILTLLHALTDGSWFEIADLHAIFLELKRQGAMEEYIHFAAGNEVDRMFIELSPEFLEVWEATGLAAELSW